MAFQKVTGTQDFLPQEKEVQKKVFDTLRKTALQFGFLEVETPAIEPVGLLTAKSGDEITRQLFVLEQKGEEKFALRFDLTVPLSRMFVENQRTLPKPVKWFCISRMWRYERPQKGRLREFYQLSVELFGSTRAEADAECINLLIACLKNLGLSEKDFVVRLNNRNLLEGLLEGIVSNDKIATAVRVIDKATKITPQEFVIECQKEQFSEAQITELKTLLELKGTPAWILARLSTWKLSERARQGLNELNAVCSLLNSPSICLSLSTARGLDYYTGTVFECFDNEGNFRSIAGGGRYDNLVGLIGGEQTCATGFAIGYATVAHLLQEKGLLPQPKKQIDYYVIAVTEEVRTQAYAIAQQLRMRATVDLDLMGRKMAKQLECAAITRAQTAIIVGPDEVAQGKVRMRDMKTGNEQLVDIRTL